jgi:hypothetical protein
VLIVLSDEQDRQAASHGYPAFSPRTLVLGPDPGRGRGGVGRGGSGLSPLVLVSSGSSALSPRTSVNRVGADELSPRTFVMYSPGPYGAGVGAGGAGGGRLGPGSDASPRTKVSGPRGTEASWRSHTTPSRVFRSGDMPPYYRIVVPGNRWQAVSMTMVMVGPLGTTSVASVWSGPAQGGPDRPGWPNPEPRRFGRTTRAQHRPRQYPCPGRSTGSGTGTVLRPECLTENPQDIVPM